MGKIFVSYARNDLGGGELQKFLDALEGELEKILGTKERVLFQDRPDIMPGSDWEETLREALATCDVFLCLYSRSCLNSLHCSKEFGLFLKRFEILKQHEPQSSLDPVINPIIPIMWRMLPSQELPTVVNKYQHDHLRYPNLYREEGVHYLARLDKHKDDFTEFVLRLAQFLSEALKRPLPPLPNLPPFDGVGDVFHTAEAAGAPAMVQSGPNSVQFVLVAGRREELRPLRTFIEYYGTDTGSWRPYLPEQEYEIAKIVESVSIWMDLPYAVLPIDRDLSNRIAAAEAKNQIVVVLADPWSLGLPTYAEPLKDYDQTYRLNTALLVVWNRLDKETRANRAALEAKLKEICRRKYRRPPLAHFWKGVEDFGSLKEALTRAIQQVQLQIIKEGEPQRPVESETLQAQARSRGIDAIAKAVIQGPAGASS